MTDSSEIGRILFSGGFRIPGKTPKKQIDLNKSDKGKKGDLRTFSSEVIDKIDPSVRDKCLKCRGTKKLCGKSRCPILAEYYSQLDEEGTQFDKKNLSGNSPPSVFVGRYDYPKVSVGPMTPPSKGDTSVYSTPEKWFGEKGFEDIIGYRGKMARGKKRLRDGVGIKQNLDRDVENTRYLALSKSPTETEMMFDKKLSDEIKLDYRTQPYGPSGDIQELEIGSTSSKKEVERVFYDDELKSEKGVYKLYREGVLVSKIQDLFMVGGVGLRENRRFVPTRWSITAVDDIIGKKLREKVKRYRLKDSYEVYTAKYLDNQWAIILTPTPWKYELIEAFYPETTWNPNRNGITIYSDYEHLNGRDEYASLGGCYYSARLAVAEKLNKEKRQAGAIVLREAHPGYILPVGVWNVRESVRNALKTEPRKCDTEEEMIKYIDGIMDLDPSEWESVSGLLRNKNKQKQIEDFI
ncbi:MAG: Protein putative to be involved in DNA repair [Candidatus Methanohalarchaeum thermophilum]|uniref:DNA repair protein n=1 Tax=Methanohalarchaeum thermophilum TaxID=1903181 RepID=A0A1Q6DU81_METT1|nr:MAG: Protein putative to be involved in DNA repair [Candidatus Methanohalarchaeum thermophilum]